MGCRLARAFIPSPFCSIVNIDLVSYSNASLAKIRNFPNHSISQIKAITSTEWNLYNRSNSTSYWIQIHSKTREKRTFHCAQRLNCYHKEWTSKKRGKIEENMSPVENKTKSVPCTKQPDKNEWRMIAANEWRTQDTKHINELYNYGNAIAM